MTQGLGHKKTSSQPDCFHRKTARSGMTQGLGHKKTSSQPDCFHRKTSRNGMAQGRDSGVGGARLELCVTQVTELLPLFCGDWHRHGERGRSGCW